MLILVVGPSGVGKDTLLDGARATLATDNTFVFPRREITRPAEAGGEDHIEIDEATFAERARSGGYALSWRAHGLAYGVSVGATEHLARGQTVVVNVSRSVIAEAQARFEKVRVILISADREHLARRLAERGRESSAEIEGRLDRASGFDLRGDFVVEVRNDRSPAEGIAALVAQLRT